MTREEYLAQANVAAFVEWFSDQLSSPYLRHSYLDRDTGRRASFRGLSSAFRSYKWNGQNYARNEARLAKLRTRLRRSLASSGDKDLLDAAVAVMEWGQVIRGNAKWLKRNKRSLKRIVVCTRDALAKNDDQQLEPVTRFNAGMTKVYSLLLTDFIIYDSRVAAALAWLVVRWCRSQRRKSVPKELRFGCLRAYEDRFARLPKLRNPTGQRLEFKHVSTPRIHAKWNLRASWVISSVLDRSSGTVFHAEKQPTRALEAALFVWGYDLRDSCPWRNGDPVD